MPTIISDKLVSRMQKLIEKKHGIVVASKRIKAELLLIELRKEVNRVRNWKKVVWEYLTHQDDLSIRFLLDFHTSVDNARAFIVFQPENMVWEHFVGEIKQYSFKSEAELVEEYIKAVGELLD